jgi:hypothetical protein
MRATCGPDNPPDLYERARNGKLARDRAAALSNIRQVRDGADSRARRCSNVLAPCRPTRIADGTSMRTGAR